MDTRAQLEKALPSLTDGEWDYLVEFGFVGDVESGARGMDYLTDHVKRMREAVAKRPRRERVELAEGIEALAKRASSRAEAVAALLAADAERRHRPLDDVPRFRKEVLRGRLIKPERVGDWIERRSRDGKSVQLVTVQQLSEIGDESRDEKPIREFDRVQRTRPAVEYGAPSGWVVSVPSSDQLERLRTLSEGLAEHYGWQPAQATNFILTGQVPIVAPIRARADIRSPLAATSRITLDVDPTVTPRELMDLYVRVRKTVLDGRRSRRMSEKHLRLAVWAYTHNEGSWGDRMRAWNTEHPEYPPYKVESNFQRDATQAIKRLLEPAFG